MTNEAAIQNLRERLARVSPDSPSRAYRDAAGIRTAKNEVISRYAPMFTPENLDNLTAEDFRSFLLLRNNHHWDSIHRQGGLMTADMNRLRQALKILVNENVPIHSRLDQIRPNGQEGMVKGLGRAVITAILQVEYPDKYGVINNTAESGMKALGLWPEFERGASFGECYETVNQVLLEKAAELGIDLWTLDMLWWIPAQDEEPEPTPMTESVFGLERYLHEFLVDNWDRLDLGKEWILLEEDGEIVGSHYSTGEVGEIDLLAKHKSDENKWLVIELKRDQSSDATVGQLLRYMGWVRRKISKGQGEVRGLVICSEPDMKMRYALDGQPDIKCMCYQVSFSLNLISNLGNE